MGHTVVCVIAILIVTQSLAVDARRRTKRIDNSRDILDQTFLNSAQDKNDDNDYDLWNPSAESSPQGIPNPEMINSRPGTSEISQGTLNQLINDMQQHNSNVDRELRSEIPKPAAPKNPSPIQGSTSVKYTSRLLPPLNDKFSPVPQVRPLNDQLTPVGSSAYSDTNQAYEVSNFVPSPPQSYAQQEAQPSSAPAQSLEQSPLSQVQPQPQQPSALPSSDPLQQVEGIGKLLSLLEEEPKAIAQPQPTIAEEYSRSQYQYAPETKAEPLPPSLYNEQPRLEQAAQPPVAQPEPVSQSNSIQQLIQQQIQEQIKMQQQQQAQQSIQTPVAVSEPVSSQIQQQQVAQPAPSYVAPEPVPQSNSIQQLIQQELQQQFQTKTQQQAQPSVEQSGYTVVREQRPSVEPQLVPSPVPQPIPEPQIPIQQLIQQQVQEQIKERLQQQVQPSIPEPPQVQQQQVAPAYVVPEPVPQQSFVQQQSQPQVQPIVEQPGYTIVREQKTVEPKLVPEPVAQPTSIQQLIQQQVQEEIKERMQQQVQQQSIPEPPQVLQQQVVPQKPPILVPEPVPQPMSIQQQIQQEVQQQIQAQAQQQAQSQPQAQPSVEQPGFTIVREPVVPQPSVPLPLPTSAQQQVQDQINQKFIQQLQSSFALSQAPPEFKMDRVEISAIADIPKLSELTSNVVVQSPTSGQVALDNLPSSVGKAVVDAGGDGSRVMVFTLPEQQKQQPSGTLEDLLANRNDGSQTVSNAQSSSQTFMIVTLPSKDSGDQNSPVSVRRVSAMPEPPPAPQPTMQQQIQQEIQKQVQEQVQLLMPAPVPAPVPVPEPVVPQPIQPQQSIQAQIQQEVQKQIQEQVQQALPIPPPVPEVAPQPIPTQQTIQAQIQQEVQKQIQEQAQQVLPSPARAPEPIFQQAPLQQAIQEVLPSPLPIQPPPVSTQQQIIQEIQKQIQEQVQQAFQTPAAVPEPVPLPVPQPILTPQQIQQEIKEQIQQQLQQSLPPPVQEPFALPQPIPSPVFVPVPQSPGSNPASQSGYEQQSFVQPINANGNFGAVYQTSSTADEAAIRNNILRELLQQKQRDQQVLEQQQAARSSGSYTPVQSSYLPNEAYRAPFERMFSRGRKMYQSADKRTIITGNLDPNEDYEDPEVDTRPASSKVIEYDEPLSVLFSKLLNPVVSPLIGHGEGGPGTGAAAGAHNDHIKQARAFVFSTKTFKMASLTEKGLHHLTRSEMKEAVAEILAAMLMTTEESPSYKATAASYMPQLVAKTTKLRSNLRKSIEEAEKVGDDGDYEKEDEEVENSSPDAIDYNESEDSELNSEENGKPVEKESSTKTGRDQIDDSESYDMEDEVDDETKFVSQFQSDLNTIDNSNANKPNPPYSQGSASLDSESPYEYNWDSGSDVGSGNRGYGSRRLHDLLGSRAFGGFGKRRIG